MDKYKTIEFADDHLILLDQTKLPLEEEYIVSDDYKRIAIAIEKLEVRGAPAIGIVAAYALALALKFNNNSATDTFLKAYNRLKITRPTAVNLFWALERMKKIFEKHSASPDIYTILKSEANKIFAEDELMCDNIAKNGQEIFTKKSIVVTHCNTGRLVSAGGGTALFVIQKAFESGLIEHVYSDETRPLLQGSRLTAFELNKLEIPFSIITDSSAAFVMKNIGADLVITGADRIARNGDTANKIGTYNLAVLAKYHGIPFYIAAPSSTLDNNCITGDDIKIEFREPHEINSIKGVQVTDKSYPVYSPAFDVTPNHLITGIITEDRLFKPPYNF
ncbi:MAG: S-methyl-5-thioribose-1-phosphate isomerase [Ignavibacteriae bacterium HGW-Ignavibacteriae-2]|jgi:methylthioribose-1-phosphate isomerase|nr:S-methyl-5-thioribose-1-phosphate isomerase [Bacteroidota bacterium]PKL89731.1 MAG: S-methyl-5-thioribose-1-phosphate isomerase [Ignavibacteriae bacterium HGW-Ignavibacteriae-2]